LLAILVTAALFLGVTLNNIYAIAIDTSPKAADMVDKLSEMMRYTMKETQ
jgi:hypothetical protein